MFNPTSRALTEPCRIFYRIGPPGTGKTRDLARQAQRAVEKHGPGGVVITSLTRAAAAEVAGRDTGVPRQNIGTLHGLCYRAVGERLTVLDSEKGVGTWNEWIAPQRPAWRLSGGIDADDPGDQHGETEGDSLLSRMNLCRHRLVPRDLWPAAVSDFAEAWGRCMADTNTLDFTGMIEMGREMDAAPGNPAVLLVDEAQDLSRLEAAVLRRWAEAAETAVFAGDEDQAIFLWRTGGGRVFGDHPVPEENRRVLEQSYRVPRAVHAFAQRIIRRVADRDDVAYRPTPAEGEVSVREDARWKFPELWIDDVLRRLREVEDVGVDDPAQGVMVLAPCAYQIEPLLSLLRREGLPFANRFRLRRGDWNPLARVGTGVNTAADQLLAYLGGDHRGWTWDDLRRWLPLMRSARAGEGRLALGAKVAVERAEGERPTEAEFSRLWHDPADGKAAQARSLTWLLGGATERDRRRLEYPARVLRARGAEALRKRPLLTVGTGHSAKGGEAAHVFMVTALPPKWLEPAEGDAVARLLYVMATRASRSLTVLAGDRGGFVL